MTDRQRAFVAHYLATLNAADAARRAGYSARVADRQGYRLLRNAEIAAAIQEGRATLLAHAELTAQRVLEEIGHIALFDIATVFDSQGHPLPVTDGHRRRTPRSPASRWCSAIPARATA